jgi:hypothetical protein
MAHSFRDTENPEYFQRLIKILSTLGEVDECVLCLADLKEKHAVHNHSVYFDRKKKLGTFVFSAKSISDMFDTESFRFADRILHSKLI